MSCNWGREYTYEADIRWHVLRRRAVSVDHDFDRLVGPVERAFACLGGWDHLAQCVSVPWLKVLGGDLMDLQNESWCSSS